MLSCTCLQQQEAEACSPARACSSRRRLASTSTHTVPAVAGIAAADDECVLVLTWSLMQVTRVLRRICRRLHLPLPSHAPHQRYQLRVSHQLTHTLTLKQQEHSFSEISTLSHHRCRRRCRVYAHFCCARLTLVCRVWPARPSVCVCGAYALACLLACRVQSRMECSQLG